MLEKIIKPGDIRQFSVPELAKLAQEIRQEIITVVSKNGGHPASSLGAVEIILALHYCLDLERDKIVFDVGHQAYAHKLLTPREKPFSSLRTYGGLSGFPSKDESIYDPFTVGHSSTAVSLALGLASSEYKSVALIGDGSLSGGQCFEGLNNAGHLKKNILVVLNTNEMSISPVVGEISTYINKIISTPLYNRFHQNLDNFIREKIPRVGPRMLKLKDRFEESFKNLLIPGVFFEELGFRYFGPLDGHNLELLTKTLKNILPLKIPVLLHVVTKKGKGYPPAEKEPAKFHSSSGFNIENGESTQVSRESYTDIFRKKIVELAKTNEKIVAISAAMPEGTGLDKFKDLYPERFFDVGIAEQHAVSFAAGLCKRALRPVVAIYSTFLQRAYDQIIEALSLQSLPVVLVLDRSGIVGPDGVTHQGVFDICFLGHMPNMTLMAPKDARELEDMLEFALNHTAGPISIRYPKDAAKNIDILRTKIELGIPEVLKDGNDAVIFSLGTFASTALEVSDLLEKKGISVKVVNARFVKPLNKDILTGITKNIEFVFSIEDGALSGGFGSMLRGALNRSIISFGLPDEFVPHGKREILLDKYNLTTDKIFAIILKTIESARAKRVRA